MWHHELIQRRNQDMWGHTHIIGHILHPSSCEHQSRAPDLEEFRDVSSYLLEFYLSNVHEQLRWEAGFGGRGDCDDLRRVVVIVPK